MPDLDGALRVLCDLLLKAPDGLQDWEIYHRLSVEATIPEHIAHGVVNRALNEGLAERVSANVVVYPGSDPTTTKVLRATAETKALFDQDYERNEWMRQRRVDGATWENLQSELAEKKSFEYLTSENGMRAAVKKHCETHGFEYRKGKPGRPVGS